MREGLDKTRGDYSQISDDTSSDSIEDSIVANPRDSLAVSSPFFSSSSSSTAASADLLNETQTASYGTAIAEGLKKAAWYTSLLYGLFVTAIYALFAEKRADNVPGYIALFASSSVLFNIFGTLLFPKRTHTLVADFSHRHDDWFYRGFFLAGSVLALMTVLASVEISQSSVSDWPVGPMWIATIAFGTNTALTRLVGGVDVLDRARRQVEFYTVFKFINEYQLKKSALLEKASQVSAAEIDVEPVHWIADQMREIPTPKLSWMAGWALWGARTGLALSSLALIPMWISMTQNGLNKLHPGWGDQPEFVTTAAMSNALFYGVSCFDVLPAMIDLYKKSSEKIEQLLGGCVTDERAEKALRHFLLVSGLSIFAGLAYFSGGGFGATVSGMEKKGFGAVANEMTPNVFFDFMKDFYSYFAQGMAGLVNLNSTARFFLAVFNKQKELPGQNFFFAMLNFMELYKKTSLPMVASGDIQEPNLNASLLVHSTLSDHIEKMMIGIRAAIQGNKFVQRQNAHTQRKQSVRNMLLLEDGDAVNIQTVEEAYLKKGTDLLFKAAKGTETKTEKTPLMAAAV